MDRPRLGRTPLRIRVSPTPGKYAWLWAMVIICSRWFNRILIRLNCIQNRPTSINSTIHNTIIRPYSFERKTMYMSFHTSTLANYATCNTHWPWSRLMDLATQIEALHASFALTLWSSVMLQLLCLHVILCRHTNVDFCHVSASVNLIYHTCLEQCEACLWHCGLVWQLFISEMKGQDNIVQLTHTMVTYITCAILGVHKSLAFCAAACYAPSWANNGVLFRG